MCINLSHGSTTKNHRVQEFEAFLVFCRDLLWPVLAPSLFTGAIDKVHGLMDHEIEAQDEFGTKIPEDSFHQCQHHMLHWRPGE